MGSMGSLCEEMYNLCVWVFFCEDVETERELNDTALLAAKQKSLEKQQVCMSLVRYDIVFYTT